MTHQSYYVFSVIDEKDTPIDISPLDIIFNSNKTGQYEVDKLVKALERVKNNDEKDFLFEAINCLRNGLVRAGVMMTWNAAIRNIHFKLLKHPLYTLNAAIQTHSKNAKQIKTIDDFAYIKESTVLNASVDLNEFDKNEKGELENCLDLRNKCGHPGKYKPEELRVAAFIEVLIGIVFSK